MRKPVQASFWLIGAKTHSPAVAIDLLDSDANLVRPDGIDESYTESLRDSDLEHARRIAETYASKHGVEPTRVIYDSDSTEFYSED